MKRAARVDANQEAIVSALLAIGASVQSLAAVGCGCPDLLVGYRSRCYVLEVKRDGGTTTPDQVKWALRWRGQYAIVRTPQDALEAIGLRGGAP